jgi:hypothetical protein
MNEERNFFRNEEGLPHIMVRERREPTAETIEKGRAEFINRVNDLTIRAIRRHLQAVSYRALRVGSSLLADNPRVAGGYETRSGHNFKPWEHKEHGWDKLCAENNAMSDAIVNGAEYIPGIVVVSHHKKIGEQPEDFTHGEKVLHSCKNCRQLFRELIWQGIMSQETIIRFVDDGSLIYEDPKDRQPFIVDNGQPMKVAWPKLKLKKPLTEEDVVGLPFEEMKMGKFLKLYKDDGHAVPGKSLPPYKLVFPAAA